METAVVLLSGGLDSATCLAMARAEGFRCHTIAFDYGQRTRSELQAAERVSAALGAESHRVIELGMGGIGGSALTDHAIDVPENGGEGIPVTYVPARNTVFLSLALGLAEVVGADAIFIGVNAVDYSGYPDCRPEFIDAFQHLAGLATKAGVEGHPVRISTPLMALSKARSSAGAPSWAWITVSPCPATRPTPKAAPAAAATAAGCAARALNRL